MDMQMYNMVKDALRNGTSAEDLTRAINQAAAEVAKPATPIKDNILHSFGANDLYTLDLADTTGKIKKNGLALLFAMYAAQQGFEPDKVYENTTEYVDTMKDVIDSTLQGMMISARITAAVDKGNEGELKDALGGFLKTIFIP